MPASGADAEDAAAIPADEDSLSSTTAFFFAVISLAIYLLFLRPSTNGIATHPSPQRQTQPLTRQARAANNTPAAAAGANQNTVRRPPNSLVGERPAGARASRPLGDAAVEVLERCKTKPPHFKSTTSLSQIKIGGTNALVDGLVAFSYTEASSSLPQQGGAAASAGRSGRMGGEGLDKNASINHDDTEAHLERTARQMRQERAKILSRLFTASRSVTGKESGTVALPTPPPKGGTVVVGLSLRQVDSDDNVSHIARVLYNLSTYYTVMVMVEVPSSSVASPAHGGNRSDEFKATQTLHQQIVAKLRNSSSNSDNGSPWCLSDVVLPSHRIMLSSSATGRVALVRQLASVELVVDFDPAVQTQLERFGYKVSVVDDWAETFASSPSKSLSPASGTKQEL